MGRFQVVVGNVGTVCATDDEDAARIVFDDYANLSRQGYGRVAGEDVALMDKGSIIDEVTGTGRFGLDDDR